MLDLRIEAQPSAPEGVQTALVLITCAAEPVLRAQLQTQLQAQVHAQEQEPPSETAGSER